VHDAKPLGHRAKTNRLWRCNIAATVDSMKRDDALQPGSLAGLLRPAPRMNRVAVGDVVRMARAADGAWFYCKVDAILDDGAVTCSVVEAQDWANLMVDGVVPGRPYTVPRDRVLSVVRTAPARRAKS